MAKNWRAILKAKLNHKKIQSIQLRNGIVLKAPEEVDLNFLFHEIWIDRIYNPKGYSVHEGDRVIDIGGNIGMFAIYAATRATNTKVYSFEPFPSNASVFMDNIKRNDLRMISLQEKAVAHSSEKRKLHVSDSWVSHSLAGENAVGDAGGRTVEVGGITLNEIMQMVGKCNLLKIDCEGSEYEIFYSTSKNYLDNIHKIVCEYHNNQEGTGNDLKKHFEKNGFKVELFKKFDETTGLICAINTAFNQ